MEKMLSGVFLRQQAGKLKWKQILHHRWILDAYFFSTELTSGCAIPQYEPRGHGRGVYQGRVHILSECGPIGCCVSGCIQIGVNDVCLKWKIVLLI